MLRNAACWTCATSEKVEKTRNRPIDLSCRLREADCRVESEKSGLAPGLGVKLLLLKLRSMGAVSAKLAQWTKLMTE